MGGVLRHHQVAAARDHGSIREAEGDAVVQPPARQVGVDRHLVVQLDPLAVLGGAGRIVLQLVEDDDAVGPGGGGREQDRDEGGQEAAGDRPLGEGETHGLGVPRGGWRR